jgi:hypothetical protein
MGMTRSVAQLMKDVEKNRSPLKRVIQGDVLLPGARHLCRFNMFWKQDRE